MRLVPMAIDKLIKVLQKMGFQPVRQTGGHLIVTNPAGKSIPIPVHGAKEIDPRTLAKILKEAKLGREEFFKLLKQILILLGITSRRDTDWHSAIYSSSPHFERLIKAAYNIAKVNFVSNKNNGESLHAFEQF